MTLPRLRRPELYRVEFDGPGQLAIMGRPDRGSLGRTLRMLKRDGVTTLVSTLDEFEAQRLRLLDEWRACKELEIDHVWWPIREYGTPDEALAADFVAGLRRRLEAGGYVVIHCRVGLGRSPMVATALLTALGIDLDTARAAVCEARGRQVPTHATQRAWVRQWAADLDSST
jgi:protein-tyrosine phosphatase